MDSINNLVGGAVSNLDTAVTDIFDNKYLFIIIIVLVLLYGSSNESRLTSEMMRLFSSPLSRIFLMGFIYYIATKNVPLAILMLTATVITINTHNTRKMNIMILSLHQNGLLKRRSKRHHRHRRISSSKEVSEEKLNRVLYKLIVGLNKVVETGVSLIPKNLTNLAVQAKQMSTAMGKPTPKIVQKIAQQIKKTAKEDGKTTPKVVKELVSQSPESSPRSTPISPPISSPVSSPKSASSSRNSSPKSENLLSPVIINKLIKNKKINLFQAEKLSKLKSNEVLNIIKPEDVMDLYVNEVISDKLLRKLLDKISNTRKPQIIFPQNKKKLIFPSTIKGNNLIPGKILYKLESTKKISVQQANILGMLQIQQADRYFDQKDIDELYIFEKVSDRLLDKLIKITKKILGQNK
jgi:hypothetical protein